ncbi:MAG: 5-guanidino-2-oxopentanoate decarboxylase [Litoreibacter sp.]
MNASVSRPLGAQISHILKDYGVDVIFGIPGVHNQEMYRGIEEAGITHILTRNEQGAGFMADGYARATGRPGVAYVITGPGLCNVMNPMGQAFSDNVPMLVVSSCLNMADLGMGRGRLHEMKDQEGAAATVCDWSKTAMSADSAYELIERAWQEFRAGQLTPKHIQVPIELLETSADRPRLRISLGNDKGGAPHESAIARVTEALKQARKPLLVLGGGARGLASTARKETSLVRLLQNTHPVVFSTYAGAGIVPENYPLNYGSSLARAESTEVIADADLVVVIGSQLSEVDLWRDRLGHSAQMIRIDISQDRLNEHCGASVNIRADAAQFLDAVVDQLGDHRATSDWQAADVAVRKSRWRSQVDAERPGILPLVEALREVTSDDTMFFSDMTQFAYVALETFPMNQPGHWHHPSGFGTLGYALPAAIGGKVGRPSLPVISINGDSGFQYNIQELATAVELNLSLPIIVWDNGKLKEIEDSMTRAQIAPNAVIARNPDFCKLAEAYGARSAAPRSLKAFKEAITTALGTDGPTVIHITPETAS